MAEVIRFRERDIHVKRRAFQRSIRIHVKATGNILVTSGRRVSLRAIVEFLGESWSWVESQELRSNAERERHPRKKFIPGEEFLYLGVPHTLHVVPGETIRPRVLIANFQIKITSTAHEELRNSPLHIAQILRKFYARSAHTLLSQRVDFYSQRMGLTPKRLSFRCQKSRWGSCSSDGSLSLNWRLLAAPLSVIDYVVVHELAHLVHPNHSKRFWSLVEKHKSNFKDDNRWLKKNHRALDFLLP